MKDGVLGAIGNTPLIRIKSLSDATGCEVRNGSSCLLVLGPPPHSLRSPTAAPTARKI